MIARGTTRVRSYAQVDVDCKLERFDAVAAAKEKFAGQASVDIIAFPQAGLLLEEGTVELMEEALKAGANVMGGIDPCTLGPRSSEALGHCVRPGREVPGPHRHPPARAR
jgi:cytosine deaminase